MGDDLQRSTACASPNSCRFLPGEGDSVRSSWYQSFKVQAENINIEVEFEHAQMFCGITPFFKVFRQDVYGGVRHEFQAFGVVQLNFGEYLFVYDEEELVHSLYFNVVYITERTQVRTSGVADRALEGFGDFN